MWDGTFFSGAHHGIPRDPRSNLPPTTVRKALM
jgi:hypothetical protein